MTPSVLDTAVFTSLRAVLLAIVASGTEVLRGEINRVPEPVSPDFVIMSPNRRPQLGRPVETWEGANPTTVTVEQSTEYVMQLDVHGPASADNAQAIVIAFRSSWVAELFAAQDPVVLAPLYADDASYLPFVNGEQQYEFRWIVAVHMQVHPALSTPAQFANTLVLPTNPADSGAV